MPVDLPPEFYDDRPHAERPLPRGVHRGIHHGVPVYFATTSDGVTLYGVHLPERIDERLVICRLADVLEREDPARLLRLMA